jgi:hypothetical protein
MVLAGLRRCRVLGLRFADAQVTGRRLLVVESRAAIIGWSRRHDDRRRKPVNPAGATAARRD